MERGEAEKKADDLLDQTLMTESRKKKIGVMSKGMGQLIQVIVTMIHDPELIILDESISGLDPVNRQSERNFLL
jgi:ABC-2 type transport system ATP-binding protein